MNFKKKSVLRSRLMVLVSKLTVTVKNEVTRFIPENS